MSALRKPVSEKGQVLTPAEMDRPKALKTQHAEVAGPADDPRLAIVNARMERLHAANVKLTQLREMHENNPDDAEIAQRVKDAGLELVNALSGSLHAYAANPPMTPAEEKAAIEQAHADELREKMARW